MSLTPPHRPDPSNDLRLDAAGLEVRLNPTHAGGEVVVSELDAGSGCRFVTVPYRAAEASGDLVAYLIAAWRAEHDQPAPPEPTPEERWAVAHRALEDAIANYARVIAEANDTPSLLIDWVLVTAEHVDLGTGVTMTTHNLGGPIDGANYKALGLLSYGLARLNASAGADTGHPTP